MSGEALEAPPRPPQRAARLPLLPVAPVVVAVLGILVATTVGFVGALQLQHTSDDAASLRSKALAAALAARLSATAIDDRGNFIARAARRSSAEILVVDADARVLIDQSLEPLPPEHVAQLMRSAEGFTNSALGRVSFAASSVSVPGESISVIALVAAPAPAEGTIGLTNAIAVLTLLLLGVAIAVALLFMRAARDDVAFVRQRIAAMAREGVDVDGVSDRRVPVRSLDQVGLLTIALNDLVERFAEGERAYLADLKQVAKIDTERSQFLAGLSHELRTPLNAILGFTHLLEGEEDGPLSDDSLEALGMIRTSGEHLKSLIDDILDLSAMETGAVRLSRAAVDVFALSAEVMREAGGTVQGRPIQLRVEGNQRAFAWADPRRLRQVLTNLVANALKATAEGHVTIRVASVERHTHVTVEDTGRGISAEVLATIFESYQQAGDAQARRGGAGLGLAIARRLVLLHGGTIEARSEVGVGSSFTLVLPDETYAATMPRDSLVPWSERYELSASGKRRAVKEPEA